MCETCGCGESGNFSIHAPHHSHDLGQNHEHDHSHYHPVYHSHDQQAGRTIDLNIDILSENKRIAEKNREYLRLKNVLCLNLVSSPGSGKTTILEKTITDLIRKHKIYVIEGDQQTLLDADRIGKTGAPAIQINTGSGCHLDAKMVEAALDRLNLSNGAVLFIENVGNLVCPALFDLGEFKRVVVISVTEGDDKPLKYPYMFQTSDLCIINKSDLLPYVDFNLEKFKRYANSINYRLEFITLSSKSGEAMEEWYHWLEINIKSLNTGTHTSLPL